MTEDNDHICGFCGLPGADKIPAPRQWPGEDEPGTEYVHSSCEHDECQRAHALLSQAERNSAIDDVIRHAKAF